MFNSLVRSTMSTLVSVFHRTIVTVVAILTIFIAVADAQLPTPVRDSSGCATLPIPPYSSLKSDTVLPDPFRFMDGTRMTSTGQWACRRAEIAALAQEFIYGYKQNTPYSATTDSMSGNTLIVTVTDSGRTISFSCSITYPSSGSAPYPAMIGVGGSFLNNSLLSSMGVAVINFPCDDIAQQVDGNSRGKGKFYTLYGSGHSAGALMAWAWGVDRLIDAIEKNPATKIDPTRLGVTGCSRNGKGALCVGAFDERIKLVIPQESGSGGDASWRVSDYNFAHGQAVQTLHEIVNENVWFTKSFSQFGYSSDKLPLDQHSIIAMVAPRAILCIENTILWLGPESAWCSAWGAWFLFDALGLYDHMGFSQYGHQSSHCGFQSVQQPEVTAYVQKFLLGISTADTYIMNTNAGYSFVGTRWINWDEPVLTPVKESRGQLSLPKGFYLEPNHPNPFNPSTTISFGIAENVFVSLKVHNSLGQEIAELAGREYSAGRHSVTFNASYLASGIYYCTLKAGSYATAEKMILQK